MGVSGGKDQRGGAAVRHWRTAAPPRRVQQGRADGASRAVGPPLLVPGQLTWIVQTQPGLAAVAFAEIAARCGGSDGQNVVDLGQRTVPERAGMALFRAPLGDALTQLRCAEDLFALTAAAHGIGAERAALERVQGLTRSARHIDAALKARAALHPGSRTGERLSFRVIARVEGEREFRRAEFQRAVERGILERGERRWRIDDDGAAVEFWATLIGEEFFLALRISDAEQRHRMYKAAHIPGSLRPSVAAALGVLSEPGPDDFVLDPFCGAGTALIERAHLGRYRLLIGSDRDKAALEAARVNVGPRYKPIELHEWGAAAIPRGDGSVNRIITNLPWGVQHSSHGENRVLYPRVFAEFARLLRADGVAVMLTGEYRLASELLRRPPWRVNRVLRVSVLGRAASIFVCRKG